MSYVYIIRCNDAVKVGFSDDPFQRIKELQTGNPVKLELVAIVPGSRKIEKQVHSLLVGDRLLGEWFRFTPTMQRAIESMKGSLLAALQLDEPNLNSEVSSTIAGLEDSIKLHADAIERLRAKDWSYTEEYPTGKGLYMRFRWGKGARTLGYRHIPGGHARTAIVRERATLIDGMIKRGCSVCEILNAIKDLPTARRGRKKG